MQVGLFSPMTPRGPASDQCVIKTRIRLQQRRTSRILPLHRPGHGYLVIRSLQEGLGGFAAVLLMMALIAPPLTFGRYATTPFVRPRVRCPGRRPGVHRTGGPSPRNCCILPARERTCRAARAEQRNTHHLARALLERLRPLIAVEVCLGEAW